jgi:hypothetical protein
VSVGRGDGEGVGVNVDVGVSVGGGVDVLVGVAVLVGDGVTVSVGMGVEVWICVSVGAGELVGAAALRDPPPPHAVSKLMTNRQRPQYGRRMSNFAPTNVVVVVSARRIIHGSASYAQSSV